MTECEEIAASMLPRALLIKDYMRDECDARVFVRRLMPDESLVVVDNVAEALWEMVKSRRQEGSTCSPL